MSLKTCSKCKKEKNLNEFHKNKTKKDGYSYHCIECHKKYQRQHYLKNKDTYINRAAIRNKVHLDAIHTHIWNYLVEHPCVDCGETDPIVLEFDHVDPKQKSYDISTRLWQSWKKLLKEIHKCDVRCANCHRRRTAQRGPAYWKCRLASKSNC